MPVYDHSAGYARRIFRNQVATQATPIDDIHIDQVDGKFSVYGEYLSVDVFPPNTDPDRPGAFIAVCEENLSAEQARLFATLLLAAADYVEYLDQKQVPRCGLQERCHA